MKLIDKDAVVAEIDRQIELLKPFLGACAGQIVAEANDKQSVLEGLKIFLNTLKVKEVQEEPVSEDLEIAAQQNSDKYDVEDILDKPYHHVDDAFKAGANYVLEQVDHILMDRDLDCMETCDSLFALVEQLKK